MKQRNTVDTSSSASAETKNFTFPAQDSNPENKVVTTAVPRNKNIKKIFKNFAFWIILFLLTFTVIVISLIPKEASSGYNPDDYKPSGAKAVVKVLKKQGKNVTIVDSQEKFLSLSFLERRQTTLVLSANSYSHKYIPLDQLADFRRIVIIGAHPAGLHELYDDISSSSSNAVIAPQISGKVSAKCSDPVIGNAGEIFVRNAKELTAVPGAETNISGQCFTSETKDKAARYILTHWEATKDTPEVVWVSTGSIFSNKDITKADNAALALTLLGQSEKVMWFFPGAEKSLFGADSSQEQNREKIFVDYSENEIVPFWLVLCLFLLAVVAISLMFLKGRRMGPLVVEPLPVVIKATETTLSRGRMYEKNKERNHALNILREAAVQKIVKVLLLPADTELDTLLSLLSSITGRTSEELEKIFVASVATNKDFVHIAQELAALEKEICHDKLR